MIRSGCLRFSFWFSLCWSIWISLSLLGIRMLRSLCTVLSLRLRACMTRRRSIWSMLRILLRNFSKMLLLNYPKISVSMKGHLVISESLSKVTLVVEIKDTWSPWGNVWRSLKFDWYSVIYYLFRIWSCILLKQIKEEIMCNELFSSENSQLLAS